MSTRNIDSLENTVGSGIRDATEIIKRLGGRLTGDSNHKGSPTWIYSFRDHQEAQVALRMNKEKLSIYVRATPHGRIDFERNLSRWAVVEQEYPNQAGVNPASSLRGDRNAAFLTPTRGRLLRLRVLEGQLEPLLNAYLPTRLSRAPDAVSDATQPKSALISAQPEDEGTPEQREVDSSDRPESNTSSRVSPEQLKQDLDRNDATGKAGEMLAYQDELIRLEVLGCPDPAAHVRLIANENVAAGYDICSEWDGERRCIEVKTTASGREQIFMTANECDTLRALGPEAWLYRVDLSAGEGGAVVLRLQNPMANLEPGRFRPVVWEVDVRKLRERHE